MGIKFSDTGYEVKPDYNNILIVDGLNFAFRYKHAGIKDYAAKYYTTIQSFVKSYEAKKVFLLGDSGSFWRKDKFKDYKISRKVLQENQTDEERQEFVEFLQDFDKTMDLCKSNFTTLRYRGVEADDIAAFLVNELDYSKFNHIWLISTDKDWDLLISDRVSRFSYKTRKEVTTKNWNEHYIYDVEDHISIKVLTGDNRDDVPGINGVAEKRAYNILRQYGPTAYHVYTHLPIVDTKVFMQNLNSFKEQILLNYELMDIKTHCYEALMDHRNDLSTIVKEFKYD